MKFAHTKYWLSILLLGSISTTIAQDYNDWHASRQRRWAHHQNAQPQEKIATATSATHSSLMAANLGCIGLGMSIGALSVIAYNYYVSTKNSNTKDIKTNDTDDQGTATDADPKVRSKQDRTTELSFDQRVEILSKSLHGMEKVNLNIPLIASLTQGYTRIKLDKFLKILKKSVTQYNINFMLEKDTDTKLDTISPITMSDVELALEEMISGSATAKELNPKELINTAIHEAGHAVATACDKKYILRSVSIIPRTSSCGRILHCQTDEDASWTINDCKNMIVISLCGGIAEQVFKFDTSWYADTYPVGQRQNFDECCKLAQNKIVSPGLAELLMIPGAISDMMHARYLADYIVKRYLKMQSSLQDKEDKHGQIENEICKILESCYQKGLKLLQTHKSKVEQIAQLLMQHEIISGDAIYTLFNTKRPLYGFERNYK
jgi:ATP-dependent Zn protease